LSGNGTCDTFSIQQAPAIVNTPLYIALAAGFGVLVALAILIAILLGTSKSKDDILLKGQDPFTSGMVVQNPLHETSTQTYSSKIFETGTPGDKDL